MAIRTQPRRRSAAAPLRAVATVDPVAVYLARLAPSSQRVMARAVETIAEILTDGAHAQEQVAWWKLSYADTVRLRAEVARRYAPSTANRHLAALRGVLDACRRLGLMTAEAYQAAEVPSVRGSSRTVGRSLEGWEVERLIAVCRADPSPRGRRDAALLALLFAGGLRRSEATSLALGDLDGDEAAIVVRGKGGATRRVYLPEPAGDDLDRWVALRRTGADGGDPHAPLLCPVRHATVLGGGFSGEAVRRRLSARAREAGVAACSPHDARRTYITNLLDGGADLAIVADLAGHAQLATTARYDRRAEATKRHIARAASRVWYAEARQPG